MARQSPIHTDPRVLKPIVEALIFASEEPLPPRVLVRLLAGERDDPKSRSAADDAATLDAGDPAVAGDDDALDAATDDLAGGAAADADPADTQAPADVEGEGWLEQEIGVEDVDAIESGSESPEALLGAFVDTSRAHAERLFPEDQIVTIDQRLVRRLIEDLNAEYEDSGRAFRIVEVAGGFQFATVREYGEYVALLSKEKQRRRLSPAALETLAIIAFRQPISKPEIEAIRGVNSDQVLLSLLEKNLVSITGRSESVGRPLLYGTTDEFLRIFGLNSLNDLPKLREIEELMEENAYSAERIEIVNVPESSDAEQIEAAVGAAGHGEETGDETVDATLVQSLAPPDVMSGFDEDRIGASEPSLIEDDEERAIEDIAIIEESAVGDDPAADNAFDDEALDEPMGNDEYAVDEPTLDDEATDEHSE
jgi:segregation and condensation protein B